MRRFIETNEAFAKRFAADLNKHFNYYIDGEITKLLKRFDPYITKSKIANINYQDLHFTKTEIIKKVTIINEIDTNQKYFYYYHFDLNDFEKTL